MECAIIAILAALTGLQFSGLEPNAAPEKAKPVAVVELFTSEGCSSCPPADRLLSDLISRHAQAGDLIALSFHVDYWNSLGWKDPWSSAGATERQQAYREGLGDRSLYTPQMVVGGSVGFVGSDRGRAEREIGAELLREKPVHVTAKARWKEEARPAPSLAVSTRLDLAGETGRDVRKWTVLVAIVEQGLSSEVRRGENVGRKLLHENVVRTFKVIEASAGSEALLDLPIPGDLKLDRATLVVLVQASPGKPVAGATRAAIPEPPQPSK